MHTYAIRTGSLFDQDGNMEGRGYSGQGSGKNNPDCEPEADHGPLPEGFYTMETPRDTATHGPFVIPLTPDPSNEMFGRSGFLIHGDSISHPGTASLGCIILPRAVREKVWASGDHGLKVIREFPLAIDPGMEAE